VFTLGDLQKLELLTLFAKHFHVQVTVGFDPILVDFDRQWSSVLPHGQTFVQKRTLGCG
jgi:hypothetical protein